MKAVEKILRAPLPDQLKALLEKFDAEFDASHLTKLGKLADELSLTWYERRMLNRAYRKARKELNRAKTLDAAMSIVLNRKEENEIFFDPANYIVRSPVSGAMVPVESLYNGALNSAGLQNAMGQQNMANNRAAQYAQGLRMHP